jgi:TonB family protein
MMAALPLYGCSLQPVPAPAAAAPRVVVQPVEVTTTYIAAYARRFARGQYAVVEVCVAPDGAVATTRVTQSSADRAFDEAAMNWARQARYYPQLENGQPVYGCREVRVEVNPNPGPRVMSGADSALG